MAIMKNNSNTESVEQETNTSSLESSTGTSSSEEPQAELTINDIGIMKNIIDIVSARGAFKPAEMVAVGQTYARITAFLDQVSKQQTGGAAQ